MRKDITSNKKIDIRLTEEEKIKIKEAAAARGMSMSEFIRWACEEVFRRI